MHTTNSHQVFSSAKSFMRMASIILPLLTCCASVRAADVSDKVDWPGFLARHDMVWNRLPDKWESGAFMGNGLLGANVFMTDDGKDLRWHIGRSDVVFKGSRIPVGDLVLKTAGEIQGCELRLGLWNAELTGKIKTGKGEIAMRSFTHTGQIVQVIDLHPSAGEAGCSFEWRPGLAANPRTVRDRQPIPEDETNPESQISTVGDVHLAFQPLRTGGGHATAWRDVAGKEGGRMVVVGVGYSSSDAGAAKKEAVDAVNRAVATGLDRLVTTHRKWWHDFWPASFLSIPDTRLESFYWIQLYKMASGTRADRPMLDLMGPWFRSTPWPRIWWNLNIQLTYWPQLVSNHLDLGQSLLKALDTHKKALAANARPYSDDSYAIGRSCSYDLDRPAKPEIGNLPWALHNYWLQYRFTMDGSMLRNRLFPLLKGSINYYLHLLKEGPDGNLHIPLGLSPEYPNQPSPNPDCNYDLSLLRWGCQTLLGICDQLKINDPLIPTWKRTLEKLTPYPTDANGLMVSASMPFAVSHRHYSHLLMIYPLYIMNLDQPENRELVTKSLGHWMGMESALRGYSFTGAASISALMGRGDDAANYLNRLLEGQRFGIHPNTMYTEAGPVIETPLSAAKSLQDMILTSWGGKIRVLPGIPDAWKDVSFHHLRTEGAFLVSAVRKDGKVRFIHIQSLAGEPCRLVTDMPNPKGDGVRVTKVAEHEYTLDLKKGRSVLLTPDGIKADLTIAPVAAQKERENYYGLH